MVLRIPISYGIKYSYLIQIICTQLYGIKYSYLIKIICTQLYIIKYSYLMQITYSYMVSSIPIKYK